MSLLVASQFSGVIRTLNLLVGSRNSHSKWTTTVLLNDQCDRLSKTLETLSDTRYSEVTATISNLIHRQYGQLSEAKMMLLDDMIAFSSYLELLPALGAWSSYLELWWARGVLAKVQRLDRLTIELWEQNYPTDRKFERVLGVGNCGSETLRRSIRWDGGESDVE